MKITKQNVAYKYRQGSGWVVGKYDPSRKSWNLSTEMSYFQACFLVKEYKRDWNSAKQKYNEVN